MTKTAEERRAQFERYGWESNSETNLATLPKDAPEGAKKLAVWSTLQGRRLRLREWIECYNPETRRIHGGFLGIGSWTHRMSHKNPNGANIFSAFDGEPSNAVEEAKAKYDTKLRSLWEVEEGHWLVGTDAEGIQLRVLAHYIDNPEYTEAIVNGRKEDKTDIHNVNMRALGPICKDRDAAKTFIYAWLLGAGEGKIANILNCSVRDARQAMDSFMDSIEGLRKLKEWTVPNLAKKGGFRGLDGRFVKCSSEHKMLAGMLQNGEAVVMKHANILWRTEAKERKLWFKQVAFVHDEWETEVKTHEDAEAIGLLQRSSIEEIGRRLGLKCPLAGSTSIARNWAESH